MKLTQILQSLKQPIPSNFISQKTIKNNTIEYISWYNLADILDERCGQGNWEWTIKDINQISNNLTLIGCLTIYGDDRQLTMMATGCETVNLTDYDDPSSNSEAMSLRRCCAKFGLGRDFWRKKKRSNSSLKAMQPKARFPRHTQNAHQEGTPSTKGQISREEWLKRKQQNDEDKKQETSAQRKEKIDNF